MPRVADMPTRYLAIRRTDEHERPDLHGLRAGNIQRDNERKRVHALATVRGWDLRFARSFTGARPCLR
jgi:hypothetical protein